MKTASAVVSLLILAAVAFLTSCRTAPTATTASATSRELQPLQLIQRIPAPDVAGRIDHFTAYPKRRLLIFASPDTAHADVIRTEIWRTDPYKGSRGILGGATIRHVPRRVG